jgi:hypothetical protein
LADTFRLAVKDPLGPTVAVVLSAV